jgi:hypothetical protein
VANTHNNEPTVFGWSNHYRDYYQDWTDRKKSNNVFKTKDQKDLFLLAMALGYYSGLKSEVKQKQSNIRVESLSERQKWALLPIAISEKKDLLCLKNEAPMYNLAEQYANEGIKVLKSQMDMFGLNYFKALEADLREILQGAES